MAKSNGHKTLRAYRPQRVNANKHKPVGLGALRNSIGRYGIGDGITVARDGESISGSARLETLAEIMPDVKIVEIETDGNTLIVNKRTDIPSANSRKAHALSAASNIVNVLDYNPDGAILAAIAAEDKAIAEMVKAERDSLRAVMEFANQSGGMDAEPQIDRAEELRKKWKVKSGQHWKVGRHTAICADSSTLEWNAEMVVTDPPFDMPPADFMSSIERYASRAIILLAGKQAFTLLKDCPNWEYRLDFVWHHRCPRWLGSNHMPIFYHNNVLVICKPKTKTGFNLPAEKASSIIETERDYQDTEMGHGKAAEVFVKMMAGFDFKKVSDPFLGAGATLIACEQTGRTCFGVEKEPLHFAVALERFKECGLSPQLAQ